MARRLAKWCSYRGDEAGALRRAVRAVAASRCGGPSGGWVYPGSKARCKAAPACGQWPQRGRQLRGVVGLRAAGCIRVGKPGARPRPLAGSGRSAGVSFAAWWAFGRLGVSGWESPVQGRARLRAVAAARASTSRCGGVSGVDNLLLLWYTDNAPTREAAVAACQKGRPSGPPLFCCSLALWWASRRCALCLARPASLRGALPPRGAGGGWGMASCCCALRLMPACLPCHEWALAWRGKRPLDKTRGGW